MSIDADVVKNLYAKSSVADYITVIVTINLETGQSVKATCYVLPPELLTRTNVAYAQSLLKLATELNFPTAYLKKIQQFIHC